MGVMSPLPDGYRHVDVPESRTTEFLEVDRLAFAFDSNAETDALVPITFEWDRAQAVEDQDGRLVSVHASYAHAMPVPGATIACSGLTWVGTRPDQRRRGLLRAAIDSHFARSLARDEPISALFAAEHSIYGRFGYGSAARWTVSTTALSRATSTVASRTSSSSAPGTSRSAAPRGSFTRTWSAAEP